ncbi:HAE1 family hydrophobic/amphiphilic exporter-1 [Dyadobacter sp. BE34]|uniref:HAE1 family hydrophobic/amphiphilic exporter-1 n=1 Tax=Dyadobacter fermentans TaxID=94254 RepID=A0ABU1R7J7_9BACT|nr:MULTISPECIES: multidrug efflux RND transporter permease subunit [Dyadobacter]MDR6809207.1 HAE1 family hydrophobic/amphiphilic exporter-1 [Dyadobacter fermentans]MDR7046950.1 HAE1 family hydrophobic/amphiphilic exporter-1 [Dyadobacter sp. BE242]MDR7201264.1 HAE1 family hydrophobic/amphiphilic exporter-1 [Dyadobacter sp. BE34]MDR7219224.1 HAE1 family hydrophobic/amphiphilic exporter-1 [Dyadobacter sp. BE31]MDR7264566.1 HAE1 family hydrophobic/amphiphilic exporter-1 [Dyadobacter sp. BE32]
MIADVFIKRPVTAIVSSVVIVLVGLIALTTLPVAQYPDVTPPTVTVSGNFTGADAQTVEQTTTTPIETQINGVPGMTYMSSNSTSSGQSSINVTFDVGTDVNIAALDVQNRVSVAEPTLPDAVKRLGLTVRKRQPSIMIALALYSPNGSHDAQFIGNYANIYIKDALQRVKGVGDIVSRADDFGMRIWLNPEKLANLRMTPSDISAALAEQNLQIAAGTVGGTPQPGAQAFEYSVLTNSRLNTKEQFENIIVRSAPEQGSVVYLRDVARVELGKFDYGVNAFVGGKPAAFVLIYQAPGANALDTYEGVMKALTEMKKTFPKDIDYVIPVETASVVKVSIEEVLHTFGEAMILVVIVVFLFLQNWRATLIPILAIPVSLIGTFIFFIPFGFTINTLTLFAFVLAIGIVVDDAIVVVEAVQHYIDEKKMSPRAATEQAMKDISGPVIAIALILAAVFVPVGFVPGIVGRLYQQFAITIAVSVLLSAFVALSLTPALCSIMLRPSKGADEKKNLLEQFFDRFNRWFDKVSRSYTRGVSKWIKATPLVLVMMVCLFVGLFFLFKNKPSGFIPVEDEGRLFVTYEMQEATSTTRNVAMIKDIMARVSSIPEVKVVGGLAGLNVISFSNKSNVGTMFVSLHPWADRKGAEHHVQAVIKEIQKRTADIKEARVLAIAPPAIPGLGATSGFTFQLQQSTSTDNIQQFEGVAREFLGRVNKRPEIAMAYTFFNARTPSYQIDVDREKTKKLGVQVNDVFNSLSTLLGSSYVNDFNLYGRNFRVMVQADSSFRSSLDKIQKFYVRNKAGNMVPLSALVTSRVVENPALISHYNIYRSVEINGTPKPGFSSGQAITALREEAAKLPAGYSYEFSGMSSEEIKAGDSTTTIFAISIVFVFLFLAALYESWSIPFSVLFAVPIGAFGSILTLTLLPNLSNNIYAQIGLITLIGLAAKNAILIVEFAKERVDNGMELVKATLEAVQLRLRPIIMTSLAFILGVLPLAFASGAAAESRKTIGWTVFGGMLAATSLAIFVVPVLFVAIEKLAAGKKGNQPAKPGNIADAAAH